MMKTGAFLAAASIVATLGCNWQRTEAQEEREPSIVATKPAANELVPTKTAAVAASLKSPWQTDLSAAMAQAKRENRPILVVSILGDLAKRC